MKSASYHSLPLSKDEALETARYYAAKLDIHRLIHIKRTSDTRSEYTFRVRVGKPRFRGTVNYTLLPHSLVLSTRDPSNVKFAVDFEEEPYWTRVVDSHFGTMDASYCMDSKVLYKEGRYSAHPHIGADGYPCLGGWGQAWSSSIAVRNIMSVVPGAKSFLNTWTANDAYWNINRYYRDFRMMPLWMRKELPFGEYLAHAGVWQYMMGGDRHRRVRPIDFPRYAAQNEDAFRALCNEYDFNITKLFHLYYGAKSNSIDKRDTEDGYRKRIRNGAGFLSDIWYTTRGTIERELSAPEYLSRDLAMEAMVGKPKLYVPAPWTRTQSDRTALRELGYIDDYVNREIDTQIRLHSRAVGFGISELLEFQRSMNRGSKHLNETWLTNEQVEQAMEYYIRARIGNNSFTDCMALVNNILHLCNIDYQITPSQDAYLDTAKDYSQALEMLYYHFADGANPEAITNIGNVLAYKALENFDVLLKEKQTRITRGKSRLIKFSGKNIRDGGQQSQISIESF